VQPGLAYFSYHRLFIVVEVFNLTTKFANLFENDNKREKKVLDIKHF